MRTGDREAVLMSGNEACVEGALLAGIDFYAGYPITPSTEIAEGLAERLPPLGKVFIQMEDEIAGMAAIIGASLTGARVMTATSGPGFSLKQENIGYAVMTEIPCVVVDVQRYGPSTGLPTSPAQQDIMQARWGSHGDGPTIALAPASVQESLTLTIQAFNLAETYRTPVILLLDEIIGHMREGIVVPRVDEVELVSRKRPNCPPQDYLPYAPDEDGIPPMADFGSGYRYHVTGLVHDASGFPRGGGQEGNRLVRRLVDKVERHRQSIVSCESFMTDDARIGVVACGSVGRSARSAVQQARNAGIPAGLLRPLTVWPFPEEEVQALARQVDVILVPEMNLGQMVHEVERNACGQAEVQGLYRLDAEIITPGEILSKLQEVS